jgi:hypothetical protein
MANKQFVISGEDEEEPSTELQKMAHDDDLMHDGDMEANVAGDRDFHRL